MTTSKVFENVNLGANCVVEDFCLIGVAPRGVEVGENAIVGAGSVVVRNVPAGVVVVGNPARVINDVSKLPYSPKDPA
jgi:acetyltransferase-like isoleucine patch superfamily enzyme